MSAASDQALIESKLTVGRTTTRVPGLVARRTQQARVNQIAPRRGIGKAAMGIGFLVLAGIAAAAGVEAWRTAPAASMAAESQVGEAKVVTITRPAPAANSNIVLPATFRPWQGTTL